MHALSREEAFAKLTAEDRRPLLILRECGYCKGTEDALLSRKLNNERTKLLTRWFHCVRFKPNVLEPTHTFRALFAGERPPHVLLATADGETIVPLDGRQSQAMLWKAMRRVLAQAYEKDPDEALRRIQRLMVKYDHYDSMLQQYREQLELELEAKGPRSPKLRSLRRKIQRLEKQRAKALEEQRRLEDLGLRPSGAKARR